MKVYVVVGIGCLECHMTSGLYGVFTDRDQAQAVIAAHDHGASDWAVAMFEAKVDAPASESGELPIDADQRWRQVWDLNVTPGAPSGAC